MIKLTRNRKGINLIEAGITIAILSAVSVCLLSTLTDSLRGWQYGTGQTIATSQAALGAQKLLNDIRDGKTAAIVSGKLVITYPRTLTNAVTGEKTYDISGTDPVTRTYQFDTTNKRITRQLGTATPTVFVRDISSATFGAHNGEVNVTLVGQQTGARSKTYNQNVTVRINLRNYIN